MWAMKGVAGLKRRLPVPFAGDARGCGFVFELEVEFFEGHVYGEAGYPLGMAMAIVLG